MAQIATPFGSNAGRYSFLGKESLENCHLEIVGEGQNRRFGIVPSDGLSTHSTTTDSPCRGMMYLEDLDLIYSFHESSVWKTNSGGTPTRIGTIPGIDNVQFTRNKKTTPQITVKCGAGVFYIESEAVKVFTDTDLPIGSVVSVDTIGEFTLFGIDDGRIFWSSQGETSQVDALDFVTAEQSADKLIGIKVDRGEVFAAGQRTVEVFNFTGNTDTAIIEFRTSIPRGLMARDTLVSFDQSLAFVADDGTVGRLDGYNFKRISTHEIERLIQDEDSQSTMFAFTYNRAGHAFYVLKGTDWTVAYDAATGQWHKRTSDTLDRWRAQFAVSAWGKTIFGDDLTGKLLYANSSVYTEDSATMAMEVITPTMKAGVNGGIVDRLWLEFLTGQGVLLSTADGYNPQVMVSYSDDGGNTWSFPRHLGLGLRGDYGKRVETWRLGMFKDKGRIWKIRMTDPVGRSLASIDAKVRPIP